MELTSAPQNDAITLNTLSIVIPVYNSRDTLPLLIEQIDSALTGKVKEYEIILVDDGSQDSSWQVICALSADHSHVHGLRLMRNYGQHNALLCGVRMARFEFIVTMDDDLQNPPEDIPSLIAPLREGWDVVYAKPRERRDPWARKFGSWIVRTALTAAMGVEEARNASAFRAFRTELREAFSNYTGPRVSIDVLLTWGTKSFTSIECGHNQRERGRSGYTFSKLLSHALDMITGFSAIPLKIASLLGFLFTLFGVGILTYVLITYLIYGSVVAGFTFLAATIAIFSGAQLLSLGIVGEYLARMHWRLMDKPAYVISKTTENKGISNPTTAIERLVTTPSSET